MEPFIFHFSPDYGKKCNWQNAMQLSLASLLRIHFGVQGTAARRREKPDLCERRSSALDGGNTSRVQIDLFLKRRCKHVFLYETSVSLKYRQLIQIEQIWGTRRPCPWARTGCSLPVYNRVAVLVDAIAEVFSVL